MNKIYQQAKDCHVVATNVYINEDGDQYAYTDAECTTKYKTSELKEVFVKGAMINISGILSKPVAFGIEDGAGYIVCVTTVNESGSPMGGVLIAEPDEVTSE